MFFIPTIGGAVGRRTQTISAPSFVGSEFGINTPGSTSTTVNVPSGSTGDLLVFISFGQGGGVADITSRPSGWTNRLDDTDANQDGAPAFFDVDTRTADGTEPASYTWNTSGASEEAYACILRFSSANSSQLDVISGAELNTGGVGQNHTAPNVTTSFDNSLILSAWMLNRSGGSAVSVTSPPSGMTQRQSIQGFAGRSDIMLYVAEDDSPVFPAGLYTGKTLQSDQTDVYSYAVTLAIRGV